MAENHYHQQFYHDDFDYFNDEVSEDESTDDEFDGFDEEGFFDDHYEQLLEDESVDAELLSDIDAESVTTSDWLSEHSYEEGGDVEEEEVVETEQDGEDDNTRIEHDESNNIPDSPSSTTSSIAESEPNSDPMQQEEQNETQNDTFVQDEIGTLPTDNTWTKEEVTRGYLVSNSRVPPRVPEIAMTEQQRYDFNDLANQHLEYQKVMREKDFSKTLYDIARYYDFVGGKWLIFVPSNLADLIWESIVISNNNGDLGGYCECGKYDSANDSFKISVYCNNFTDAQDCIYVHNVLNNILSPYSIRVTTFKPQFLSYLGVYKHRKSDKSIDCRYTFAELNIVNSWLLPEFKQALSSARGNVKYRDNSNSKKRGGRKHRRRNRTSTGTPPKTPYYPELPNRYQTNKVYKPSRPNSRWTKQEQSDRQLVHYSNYAPNIAARTPKDIDAFLLSAKRKLARWQQITPKDREHRRKFMARLYELAESANYTIGKWKIFTPAKVADEVWTAICKSNARGNLGGCVKICEYNPRSGAYLVCVYVNDFTQVDECIRILHELERICSPYNVHVHANFKADFLTKLGIYHSRNARTNVQYTFGELHVARDWAYAPLKNALDEIKRSRRSR